MIRELYILILLFFSVSVFGQKAIQEDTIQITKADFNRTIMFNHEALYHFSGNLDESVLSIIDADEFLNYVTTHARTLLYECVTDKQVERFKTDFKSFFKSTFAKVNSYTLQRPDDETTGDWRNMLKDMNYAIFMILREKYYSTAMEQGFVKFQLAENYDFANYIAVKITQRMNNETGNLETQKIYTLDKQNREIFSSSKWDRIDKSKMSLSNPNPVEWKVIYKKNADGTLDLTISAKIAELWRIFALNQPVGKDQIPTTIIRLDKSNKYELIGKIKETNVKSEFDKRYNSQINYHTDNVEFCLKIKMNTANLAYVTGSIIYMPSSIETISVKTYNFKIDL